MELRRRIWPEASRRRLRELIWSAMLLVLARVDLRAMMLI
jgi:hypothetical protein